VKVPTGGKEQVLFKPASARFGGVSRFGVNPKPTVIVRMEENRKKANGLAAANPFVIPICLGLLSTC
tara:strand:- start:27511 stop:27711 length:201 start_codon:yes stop_codon:yes gene_type:complete